MDAAHQRAEHRPAAEPAHHRRRHQAVERRSLQEVVSRPRQNGPRSPCGRPAPLPLLRDGERVGQPHRFLMEHPMTSRAQAMPVAREAAGSAARAARGERSCSSSGRPWSYYSDIHRLSLPGQPLLLGHQDHAGGRQADDQLRRTGELSRHPHRTNLLSGGAQLVDLGRGRACA